jgi:hypothetical protein
MRLGRYQQQPGEKIKRIVDLTQWLEADETITDLEVRVSPDNDPGLECTSAVVDPGGKKFAYWLEADEDGDDATYVVEFSTTTQTQIREDEIEIEVEEIS